MKIPVRGRESRNSLCFRHVVEMDFPFELVSESHIESTRTSYLRKIAAAKLRIYCRDSVDLTVHQKPAVTACPIATIAPSADGHLMTEIHHPNSRLTGSIISVAGMGFPALEFWGCTALLMIRLGAQVNAKTLPTVEKRLDAASQDAEHVRSARNALAVGCRQIFVLS